jgi:hypothetical protein
MTISILVSFQIGLLVQSLLTAIQPVVFGISVLLIHIRVGLGWATDVNSGSTPTEISINLTTLVQRSGQEYDVEQGK